MKKLLLVSLMLAAFAGAHAATLAVTPGSGATLAGVLNGSDFLSDHVICDPTTPTQCWGINSSHQAAMALADGADITLGAIGDAAASAGGTGTISAKLREISAQLAALSVTANLGTLNGAATAALQTTGNASLATIAANTAPKGLGALTAVPAGSTNGTALGTPPTGMVGVRLYLPSGASITFAVAASAPGSPPLTFTVSASTTGPNWDENLIGGEMIYVTATAGSPLFRWF